jgi:acyl-coenzyme A thioesterase PaaI-like protein
MLKKSWVFKLLMNMWPPLLFSRIKLIKLTKDFREAKVRMTLSAWNKNAMGAHFGGSLFAMTDPFYMMMLMAHLGKGYIVWDKSADIDFIKPGRGTVYASFALTDELLKDIENNTAEGDKYLPEIPVDIINEQGEIIAKVNKTLYVRKKMERTG